MGQREKYLGKKVEVHAINGGRLMMTGYCMNVPNESTITIELVGSDMQVDIPISDKIDIVIVK